MLSEKVGVICSLMAWIYILMSWQTMIYILSLGLCFCHVPCNGLECLAEIKWEDVLNVLKHNGLRTKS